LTEEPKSDTGERTDEELRAELEEEIRKVRIEDLLLQSMVSILNLSARRIAKDDERDLEQAKVGIDACRAIVDLLPEEAQGQVREALAELQMLYAKHAAEEENGGSDEEKASPAPGPDTPAGEAEDVGGTDAG
jgi:hypothetical protein